MNDEGSTPLLILTERPFRDDQSSGYWSPEFRACKQPMIPNREAAWLCTADRHAEVHKVWSKNFIKRLVIA